MIVYSCDKMCLSFAGEAILENINVTINEKDRIGIVGDNGAGKTTFIKVLLGEYLPTDGNIYTYSKFTSDFGYLPQNAGLESENKVYDEFLNSFSHLIEEENKIAALEESLKNCSQEEAMVFSNKLNVLYDNFVKNEGLTYKSRIESILVGLGFTKDMWSLNISNLSGGQKTRLALGKIILKQPKVLILDEPTNHLDADSVKWLEEEIKAFKGTLLVISHDRCFLDAVTDKTLLIENTGAYLYNAPYSKYIELRNHDLAYQERCYKQQQRQIAKIQAFIEKQRQWNRERNIIAAESRLKQLEKMTIIEKPDERDNTPDISFEIEKLGGKEVLDVNNLSFAFTDNVLFEGLTFQVRRGEKVFIQGPNGCGKSTFLKIITGYLKATKGEYKIGSNTSFSYYAQDLSTLNEDKNVFDEIYDHANFGRLAVNLITPVKIRKALAAFGFKGEDVFKPISKLSGGEKSRVALLKIVYERSSLLILDEPTNHLDIKTREVLEKALADFEGTLICVSHDRYFTQKLATKEINIPDYCIKEMQENTIIHTTAGEEYRKNKEERAKIRKAETQKLKLEKEADSLCTELCEIESELESPEYSDNYEGLNKLYNKKIEIENRMEEIMLTLDSLRDILQE
ncbi:MAG: ABC-F family ATP-binding cassette domain-containing protein [Clostridia bacterium]|nr:ABC-F family ATP-binding cassette domain-containing protein [Clostridia bacterium]